MAGDELNVEKHEAAAGKALHQLGQRDLGGVGLTVKHRLGCEEAADRDAIEPPRQALTRLRFICQLADTSSELPMSALNSLVAESIDVVVHCTRTPAGPRVSSIVAVEDLAGTVDNVQFTTTQVFARTSNEQPLIWTGHVPARLAQTLGESGFDVRTLLGATPTSNGLRQ